MIGEIKITGLGELDKDAREILEHIEAINKIMRGECWTNVRVTVDLKEETASGN